MLFHPERDLVFGLHAKAASRWLEKVLMRRGFRMVGSRHEGPRNLTLATSKEPTEQPTAIGHFGDAIRTILPIEDQWWLTDPRVCDYAYVVRDHGDALLSWWSTFKGAVPECDQEKVCPVFLQEWPRQYPRLFLGSRRLWRFVYELPGASVLYFESLVKDTDRYLDLYDLGCLESWEMAKDPAHVTDGKPQGDWQQHFTLEGLDYLKTAYRIEAMHLGYRL